MIRITTAMLKGACRRQRAIFRREWPNGAPITLASVRKTRRLGLDVEWLVSSMLSASAEAAYNAAIAPAWAAYDAAIAPAWAAYDAAIASAEAAYNAAIAPAWAAYNAATAPIIVKALRAAMRPKKEA